jgi:hypothetical protein
MRRRRLARHTVDGGTVLWSTRAVHKCLKEEVAATSLVSSERGVCGGPQAFNSVNLDERSNVNLVPHMHCISHWLALDHLISH